MSTKILKENISIKDKVGSSAKHAPTLWAKTRVIGGYGLHKNSQGISSLDEVVFDTENMVPLIGVQYAMEMIFGVEGSIPIPALNDTMLIGAQGSSVAPIGSMPYPYGQKVCLFGIGTGGAAENNLTELDVKYNETNVVDMIPFRYTNEALPDSEEIKYYGKKIVDDTMAYYLKRFDVDPVVRHLYKNGKDGEDGSEVDSTYFSSSTELGVESFTEIYLTITKKDVREWFEYNGNIEEARVNTIGLYTATYDADLNDYANIQLFSKLNIPTEPLSLTKDMNIIYRVYGA